MVLSDPELLRPDSRLRSGGQIYGLHFFDDIGCAVIWLDDTRPWRGDPRAEMLGQRLA